MTHENWRASWSVDAAVVDGAVFVVGMEQPPSAWGHNHSVCHTSARYARPEAQQRSARVALRVNHLAEDQRVVLRIQHSHPAAEGIVRFAQDLYELLVVLAGGILSSGGRLVFGGHPSVTPLLHRVAKGAGVREGQVTLFQLERFRQQAPAEVQDRSVFGEVRWCEDLESMREGMAAIADAGVFVGGKTAGDVGNKPGIRDEFERFVKRHPLGPVYLLGLLDGETRLLIEEKSGEQPWGPRYLSGEERDLLRFASSPDLAAGLVLADLAQMVEAGCR